MKNSTGEFILYLDAGISPASEDCLDEMRSRLAAPGVSAVGGLELWPDHIVLQAGVVLGVDFGAVPAFAGLRVGALGYADALNVARGCGALDAACLMVCRPKLADLGGFDEVNFPERFSGADLSMRLRGAGGTLIFTPHACFVRGIVTLDPPEDASEAELTSFRNRWGQDLLEDPYYNPALNLDHRPFTGLAWPPRQRRHRYNERPQAYLLPTGF